MLPKRLDRAAFERVLKFSFIVFTPLGFISALIFPWYVSLAILVISAFILGHIAVRNS